MRVELPGHLCRLAGVPGCEVRVAVSGGVTLRAVFDAVEAGYPALCGTIREYGTGRRRAFLRFFVRGEDWSERGWDEELPPEVARGEEPVMVVGAIAGG